MYLIVRTCSISDTICFFRLDIHHAASVSAQSKSNHLDPDSFIPESKFLIINSFSTERYSRRLLKTLRQMEKFLMMINFSFCLIFSNISNNSPLLLLFKEVFHICSCMLWMKVVCYRCIVCGKALINIGINDLINSTSNHIYDIRNLHFC